MTQQIHDAIRHLEKDMADILEVMQDKDTIEIILNPYRKADGSYEGHLLVEQHGRGLINLTSEIKEEVLSPKLEVGNKLLVKKINQEIVYRQKITTDILFQAIIADVITKNIVGEQIVQTTDMTLLTYAWAIRDGYFKHQKLDDNQSSDLYKFLESVNDGFLENIPFKLELFEVTNQADILSLPLYPKVIIKTDIKKMSATKAETIMSVLASITGKFIHNKSPYLECQIPKYGHRFTGVIPPASVFPAFCIRKHSPKIFTLKDLVLQGVMEETSRETIISWIKRKFNILIAGGTGSGKTTLANAILFEIANLFPDTRVLIIEDVPELQFNTTRSIALTINEFFSMYNALRTTLRFKPERIVMGEVRGAEAYTLLKAWNTGHPGGIATIHANGVNEALYRFESCIRDHPNTKVNRAVHRKVMQE